MVLLDTCALIWLAAGDPISAEARRVFEAAEVRGQVLVSPVSAWEIGLLSRPGRPGGLTFLPDPKTWYLRVLAAPGFRHAPFTPEIAIDSSHLPAPIHGDPGDRLLIATARHLNAALLTGDRLILEYAALGHVEAIAC